MPTLRQRFIEDMKLHGLASTTQKSYLHYVVEYAKYFNASPEHLDLEAMRQFVSLPAERAQAVAGEHQRFRIFGAVPLLGHFGDAMGQGAFPARPTSQTGIYSYDMLKKNVKITGVYVAKVSGKVQKIRINSRDELNRRWRATNLATGRPISIKSAAKLRAEVTEKRRLCAMWDLNTLTSLNEQPEADARARRARDEAEQQSLRLIREPLGADALLES